MGALVSGEEETEAEPPTAKQTFGRGHETPLSVMPVALGGSGVGTICQLVPSQRSATVVKRGGSPPPPWNIA